MVDCFARILRRKHVKAACGPHDLEGAIVLFGKALPQATHLLPFILEVGMRALKLT